MASFTAVAGGNPTNAADINQLINALNGTTASQIFILSTANNAASIFGYLPSSPPSDQSVIRAGLSADTQPRAALYMRSSDTYGGLLGGSGSSITAHLYAQAGGWRITETLTVDGAITLTGGGTVQGNNIMQGVSTNKVTVASSAPGSPATNDIWFNTSISL